MYFHERPILPKEPPPSLQTLDHLETRQGWHMIYFKGNEKIGFYHYTISPTGEGNYKIKFQSLQRFKLLGIKKEIRIEEEDIVAPDMRFIATTTRHFQDGKEQIVTGSLEGDGLRVEVVTEHHTTSKNIPVPQPLYSEAAIDFLPVLRGLIPGREYRYQAFSPTTQSVGEVVQRVVRYERSKLLTHDAYRVETSFQNINATSWFNDRGEKDLEILLGGLFISERQTEKTIKQFILDKTLAHRRCQTTYNIVIFQGYNSLCFADGFEQQISIKRFHGRHVDDLNADAFLSQFLGSPHRPGQCQAEGDQRNVTSLSQAVTFADMKVQTLAVEHRCLFIFYTNVDRPLVGSCCTNHLLGNHTVGRSHHN